MKHTQMIKFMLTSKEMQTLTHAGNIIDEITAQLSSGYNIKTYNDEIYTIDELNNALDVVYSIGCGDTFVGYDTSSEES